MNENGKKQRTLYLSQEIDDWVVAKAGEERRSVNAQIEYELDLRRRQTQLTIVGDDGERRLPLEGASHLLEQPLDEDADVAVGEQKKGTAARARTAMCPHRVPPGTFCKTCGS